MTFETAFKIVFNVVYQIYSLTEEEIMIVEGDKK